MSVVIDKICNFIERHSLLSRQRMHLVALSGGADSVALLRALLSLGYEVQAVHCNFHLRGEESDRDEAFCTDLCRSLNVGLHIAHFDTREYAARQKISIEMAARQLRYDYFDQLRRTIGTETICVAHHRDDQAETVLLNLLRGTGIEGLKGMLPKNGCIARPMLGVSRCDIIEYLASIKQDFITDSSNSSDSVLRNKLRLNILPLLQTVNAEATENIARCAEHVADALPLLRQALSEARGRCTSAVGEGLDIDIAALRAEVSAETVLWDALRDYGFTSAQVHAICCRLDAPAGTTWNAQRYCAVADRGRLLVRRHFQPMKPMEIPSVGTFHLCDGRQLTLERIATADSRFRISRSASCATLDAAKVSFPLTLRHAAPADRFVPFGMRGSKLVSDFLTDQKVALPDKQRQLVLADATGKIVWLPAFRTSNLAAITPATTEAIVVKLF